MSEIDLSPGARAQREREQFTDKLDGRKRRRRDPNVVSVSFRVDPTIKAMLHRMSEEEGCQYVETFTKALKLYDRYLKGEL